MTFFDGWRALNTCLDASDLTAPTQLVAYKLFAIFNERRFPESLLVSDRELLSRTNLKSTKTIFEARRQLKNAGIFDFTAEPGKTTRYNFGKQLVNSSETVSKQLVNSSETPGTNSNIRVREDKDIKTQDIQSVSHPRACAGAFNWNTDVEERLTALWIDNRGAGVTFELLSYFRYIVEKHGVLFAEELIREMAGALKGDRMTLNFLRGCYKRKLEGGDRNVRVGGQSRVNRPNVLAFAAGRTASDSGNTQTGKGRFDDDEPDYSWLYEEIAASKRNNPPSENGTGTPATVTQGT